MDLPSRVLEAGWARVSTCTTSECHSVIPISNFTVSELRGQQLNGRRGRRKHHGIVTADTTWQTRRLGSLLAVNWHWHWHVFGILIFVIINRIQQRRRFQNSDSQCVMLPRPRAKSLVWQGTRSSKYHSPDKISKS